jgi:transcriptional regulator with PAS, ATPase and Fis domain
MLPAAVSSAETENPAEREAIIRMLFQLKQDVDYLKDVVAKAGLSRPSAPAIAAPEVPRDEGMHSDWQVDEDPEEQEYEQEESPENTSIKAASRELIEKVLRKHGGNRKLAAAELGISERTLYRKIKQNK